MPHSTPPYNNYNKATATATAFVDKLNYDGRGVARVNGKVTFIEGALPGEEVLFSYSRRRKTYDSARTLQILAPSPDRIAEPDCTYFGTCGGCALQHLRPDAQITAKEQVLRDSLVHIGKVEAESWLPPLTGPVWGYRRKARLGVRLVPKKGGVIVGFRERKHSFITPLADCKTLDPRFARLLVPLRDLIARLSCPSRIPQIEIAAGDDDAALVFRHLHALTQTDHEQLWAFGEQHQVQIHLQPGGPESVHPLWPEQPPLLAYRLPEHEVEIRFSATDFTQVNAVVNEQMVSRVIELLDPQPNEQVLDLFCGVGNFTLPLARRAASVVGVERDIVLLERASDNAIHNRLSNVEFRQADLGEEALANPWGEAHFDKLLLDPPRSGAMEAIKRLSPNGPARIVYVSCYPATFARDSEYLVHALGYRLVSACVMDMFPQTSHAESMALFVRA